MERFKLIYVWKCLKGLCPNIGFEWMEEDNKSRRGRVLKYPKIHGTVDSLKTLQRASIKYEGVRLFNSLPDEVRLFSGSMENMKVLIDAFLKCVPDHPEVDDLKPVATDESGSVSNSLVDWIRTRPSILKSKLDVIKFRDDRGELIIRHNTDK